MIYNADMRKSYQSYDVMLFKYEMWKHNQNNHTAQPLVQGKQTFKLIKKKYQPTQKGFETS
jgi:hypothetical protein